MCVCVLFACLLSSYLFPFSYVSSYLPPYSCFPSRIGLLCFQAGGSWEVTKFGFLVVSVYFTLKYPFPGEWFVFVILSLSLSLGLLFVIVSPGFEFVFSVLAKRLAGKSVSKMTCFVSSAMLNLNWVYQSRMFSHMHVMK